MRISALLFFKILIIVIFSQLFVFADGNKFGAGFIIGSPSGITGKLFISESDGIDFGIGVVSGDDLYLYGDYLRHFHNIFPVESLQLFIGIGPGFHRYEKDNRNKENEKENRLEIRIPVGFEYLTRKIPLGLFIEITPALNIIPDVDFHIRAGLGIRYYF